MRASVLGFTTSGGAPSTAATNYAPIAGAGIWATTDAAVAFELPDATTIDQLEVTIDTAPGAGKSRDFIVQRNGVDTGITLTITGATQVSATDLTHSQAFSAGDTISLKTVPHSTPGAPGVIRWSVRQTAAGQLIGFGGSNTTLTAAQYLPAVQGSLSANEADVYEPVPFGCTIRKLRARASVAPGTGNSVTVTTRKNSADALDGGVALAATISDTATSANDATHAPTYAAGDLLAFHLTVTGTPASTRIYVAYVIVPTTDGESAWMSSRTGTSSTSATNYAAPNGSQTNPSTTEAPVQEAAQKGTITGLFVKLSGAPGASKTYTVTVRKNGVDTTATVAITGAATTTGSITGLSIAVNDGDLIALSIVPASTPAASRMMASVLFAADPGAQIVAVGRASETDTANAGTHRKTVQLGRATATQTARPVTAMRIKAVARVAEADLARAVAHRKTVQLGRAVATQTARPVTARRIKAFARAVTTNVARALTHGRGLVIGRAARRIDDFAGAALSGWDAAYKSSAAFTVAQTGGRLRISSTNAQGANEYAGIEQTATRDLVNGGIAVNFATLPGAANSYQVVYWAKDSSHKAQITYDAGAGVFDAGVFNASAVQTFPGSYSGADRYFRIRGESGTLYFEHSSDGVAWTAFASQAITWQPTTGKVGLYAESDTAGAGITAEFDDLVYSSSGAAEADAARAVTARRTRPIGRASEADLARTIVRGARTVTLGRAIATQLARAFTHAKTRPLGRAIATQLARPITARRTRPVGRATSTQLARPITARRTHTIGRAVETDTARVMTRTWTSKVAAGGFYYLFGDVSRVIGIVNRATTTNIARAIRPIKTRTIGRAVETDIGRRAAEARTFRLGRASETDTARPLTHSKARAVLRAAETELARLVKALHAHAVGRAAETETARPLTHAKIVQIGRAAETDTARSFARLKTRTIGRAVELDAGRATRPAHVPAVTRAAETDTARTVTAGHRVTVGRALEHEFANGVVRPGRKLASRTAETDAAFQIRPARAKSVARAAETDAARPFTHSRAKAVARAITTNVARAFTHARARLFARAAETDTARIIQPRKIVHVGRAVETSSATGLHGAKVRTLGRAIETESTGAIKAVRIHAVGRAVEIEQARAIRPERPVRRASETDAAFPMVVRLGSTRLIQRASETDQAREITPRRRVHRWLEGTSTAGVLEAEQALSELAGVGSAVSTLSD